MTKLKIALHGNLYFWIHESENAFCCIFFLWYEEYEEAAKRPFGYLLIDLKTTAQDNSGEPNVSFWKISVRKTI